MIVGFGSVAKDSERGLAIRWCQSTVQAGDTILDSSLARDHDDPDGGKARPDPAAELEAAGTGKADVE